MFSEVVWFLLQRHDLAKLERDGCNDLLKKKGFYKKSYKDEDVPEEFQSGPYVEREEL